MDAAKILWLMYEQPEIAFEDVAMRFMDIRKRIFMLKDLGQVAKLICIPTTSGTGSEISSFSVITDDATGIKYPLADYAFTPSMAIIDPDFVMTMPKGLAAASGIDAVTHCLEAYVSTMASPFTDSVALEGLKLLFKHLPKSVNECTEYDREQVHYAATLAGMAFANAFLGMNHSLAHKIGGIFHTAHGKTNAILLPHVIRYNGTVPQKLSTWPKYDYYKANIKYQEIAQLLGLKASTPEEGVESLAQAVMDLGKEIGIKMNLQDAGIDEKEFNEHLDEIALLAYEDQCSPANPRVPLVEDMKVILKKAYKGN